MIFWSRTAFLTAHLLKWRAQPGRRSRSWEATIRIQRRELARLLADMPSLKAALTGGFEEIYRNGVLLAVADTNLPEDDFPCTPDFGIDQLLDEKFLPSKPVA